MKRFICDWYAVGDGGIYGSNNIEVNSTKVKKIGDGNIKGKLLLKHPTLPRAYIYEVSTQSLVLYDELIANVALDYPLNWQYEIAIGNNGLGDEIYLYIGEHKLYIFDANTLNEKAVLELDDSASAILTNDKGWIAVKKNSYTTYSLKIYNRNNLEAIDSIDILSVEESMFFTSKSENKFLLSEDQGDFYLIDLEDDGTVESAEIMYDTFGPGVTVSLAHLSPDEQFLLNYGEVYNHQPTKFLTKRGLI